MSVQEGLTTAFYRSLRFERLTADTAAHQRHRNNFTVTKPQKVFEALGDMGRKIKALSPLFSGEILPVSDANPVINFEKLASANTGCTFVLTEPW